MGVDIHLHLIKFNYETGKYDEVKLYKKDNKTGFEAIPIYCGRDYELFNILKGHEDDFPCKSIYENNLPEELIKEINKDKTDYCYGFLEANLADIKLYLKNHPRVRDYDWEDEETFDKEEWKDNPVKHLIDLIEYSINFWDDRWGWYPQNSDVRLIYWFDC